MTKQEIISESSRLASETEILKESVRKYYAGHNNGWNREEIIGVTVDLLRITNSAEVTENFMRNIMQEVMQKGQRESVIINS